MMKWFDSALTRCLGWLTVLFLVLLTGCRTREIAAGDWERSTCGLDEYQVHEAMVRAGAALNWEMDAEELRSLRLSMEDPRWKLVIDVVNQTTNVAVRVVDAVGLNYDPQWGTIHRVGNNHVHALLNRIEATLVGAAHHPETVPYVVRERIVGVSQGRTLTSVVQAVCSKYGLTCVAGEGRELLVTSVRATGNLKFSVKLGDVSFSIVSSLENPTPVQIAQGNAVIRILEGEIEKYADLQSYGKKQQADREHRQQMRTENEVRRLRRAVLWGF